jgi:AcrR family transcriptional regulator
MPLRGADGEQGNDMAPRRIGAADSKTREVLLDAAESLMRESGYAGVTSRRLAAQAGLKPPLVHYYFRTMDDLFLALLQRVEKRMDERQNEVLKSDKPLKALWDLISDPAGMVLTHEFIAMAHHRKSIRAEIAEFGSRARQGQAKIIAQALKLSKTDTSAWHPAVLAVLVNAVARAISLEDVLGISFGHNETLTAIRRLIAQFEA